jgi:histone deacetylase complex regulatory component SIN3
MGVTTDASKSGLTDSVSGTATTTVSTSENTNVSLYFYIGETTQNVNLINAGRIEETVVQTKTDLNNKINNLLPSNSKLFDGQVTYTNRVTIFNTTTVGTYAVDLSAYVPNDGCGYDLYVAVSMGAGSDADGNDRNINIYDATGVTLAIFVSDAINKQICSNAVLPLKPATRAISVALTSTNNATFSRAIIYLNAVRRRGTNA